MLAYFDGFDEGIFLKRYRCPGCGCVIRLRPDGVNGRDKLSQKWSFKSEPLWKGFGIYSMLSNLVPS